jgi:hypothetical protein
VSGPLTVAAEHPALLPRFGRTLASLPISYTAAEAGSVPQVMLVSGAGDWPHRAADAIATGCRGIVVADPGFTPADGVAALADLVNRNGTVVELSERHAGDATLRRHQQHLARHLLTVSTIVVSQIGSFESPAAATLEIVRTLRVLGYIPRITDLWTVGQAAIVRGVAGAIAIEGMTTAGSAGVGQRIAALGFGRTLRLTLHGDGSARPADIRIANARGERKMSGVYESADRAAWRRMSAALGAGASDAGDLRLLADDLTMIGDL